MQTWKFVNIKQNTEILRYLHVCSKAEQTEEDTEGRHWGAFRIFCAAARTHIIIFVLRVHYS
jgi:hypothetical protein